MNPKKAPSNALSVSGHSSGLAAKWTAPVGASVPFGVCHRELKNVGCFSYPALNTSIAWKAPAGKFRTQKRAIESTSTSVDVVLL